DHSIGIYSVAELLRNRTKPLQRLESAGMTVRSVAFLQKKQGQDIGLFLSAARQDAASGGRQPPDKVKGPARMAKEDLVFDFAGRSLTPDPRPQGWAIADPTLDGWRVKSNPSSGPPGEDEQVRWRVEWEGPNTGGRLSLDLSATEIVTHSVLVPPSPFSRVPTL